MAIFSSQNPIGNSTAISGLQFDFPTSGPPPDPLGIGGDIHVRFRRGRTYVYAMPSSIYMSQFLNAPSKGRYYVRVIKARFDYYRKY